jgi:hypothetical protein
MKAKILKIAEDEGLPSTVEIEGISYEAMDCIGYGKADVKNGDVIDINFTIGVDDDDENCESILNGNTEKLKKLVCTGGWSYRAYGEIISIDPIIIDCGVARFENDVDLQCIGEYIAFNIIRLDVWST